jgi:UDP-N-acetyl-2-amino-2-deoxyglucuronate dehydrogenase
MSLEVDDVPSDERASGQRTYRSITVDGAEIEFSGGFFDLHTRSYEAIFAGNGFGLEENRTAIEAVSAIRSQTPRPTAGEVHPAARAHL